MDGIVGPLRKYAVFSGRARRQEYWMFTLVFSVVYVVLAGLGVSAKSPALVVVAFVGTVVMLIFLCTESEPGEHRFGPCPKVIPAHR